MPLPPLLSLSDFQIGFRPPCEQSFLFKREKEKDVFTWMCKPFEITEGRTSALINLVFSFSQTGDDNDDDDDKLYNMDWIRSYVAFSHSLASTINQPRNAVKIIMIS